MDSVIRLFRALPVASKEHKKTNVVLLKETIKRGFIFDPSVIANYPDAELARLVDVVSKEVGLESGKANASFHKSWRKVHDADIEQLVIEQVVHYITTYGFEAMGVFSQDTVYIPTEKLTIPKINVDRISLVVIKGYTKAELKAKLIVLLGSGIALKEDTKKDVIDVATYVDFTEDEIYAINNKEVRIALYELLDVCPEEPVEFLRYLIYKTTNSTLLIKDGKTIADIKAKDGLCALGLLQKYDKKVGLATLGQIFYRFKPLFLAFRTNKKLKSIINKIRKHAIKNHKPMKEDYLNTITAKLARYESIDKDVLIKELGKVNTFRKIRLAYALKYRTNDNDGVVLDSILYRIRNGKSYATKLEIDDPKGIIFRNTTRTLDIILDSIISDIRPKVEGKKICIPDNIHYALPTTEKQFTGDLPSGTYVSVPKDLVLGVHWFNVGGKRVDLDLSLIRCDGGKLGWDGSYRTGTGDILFSGDMTNAPLPDGAAELFYIQKQKSASFLMVVNYFNFGDDYDDDSPGKAEVPFKIVVASEPVNRFDRGNYMVNPNNVVCIAKSKMTQKQKILGLLVTTPEECRFYFAESAIGNSITSSGNSYIQQARKFLFDYYQNTISLKEILEEAGAIITIKDKDCDIDLSYEKVEKDTLIKLLTK